MCVMNHKTRNDNSKHLWIVAFINATIQATLELNISDFVMPTEVDFR